MATAKDLIKRARRLIGALGNGEEPSAETLVEDLSALNDMLDSWSIQNIKVHHFTDTALSWPSGSGSRTIGATGDFAQTRPLEIRGAFERINDQDYPVNVLSAERWYKLTDKTVTSTRISDLWYERTFPNATIHVWPVPSENTALHITALQELQSFDNATDTVTLPKGYARAIAYSLAVELAPEYGRRVPQAVRATQMGSLSALKSSNKRIPSATIDLVGMQVGAGRYNIYSDTTR